MPSLLQWVKLKATGKFSSAIKKSIKKENKTKISKDLKTKLQQRLRNIICFFENLVAYLYILPEPNTKTIQASRKFFYPNQMQL